MLLALAQGMSDRFADAVATGLRGTELARRTGQEALLVPLENALAMAFRCLGDLDATHRHGEAAEEGARLRGATNQLQFALWLRATHHEEVGEREEAARAAAECARLLERLEPSALTASGACSLAALHADRDPERCLRDMVAAGGRSSSGRTRAGRRGRP
jgi:hypothetical protein